MSSPASSPHSSSSLVRDLVPVLHFLRSVKNLDNKEEAEHEESEEEEVERVLRLLQLPTSELDMILADGGLSFDDLELVRHIRQCTRKAMLSSSQSTVSSSENGVAESAVLGCDLSSGNLCQHRRMLEALRQDVARDVSASTEALSVDDLVVSSPIYEHVNKKCK